MKSFRGAKPLSPNLPLSCHGEGDKGGEVDKMENDKDIIQELESFLKELRDYYNFRNEMQQRIFTSQELERVANLRRMLVRKCGKYKKLIAETTGIETVPLILNNKEYLTDIWTVGLLANPVKRTTIALGYCIDSVGQSIGKIEEDIKKGIRDDKGNLIGVPSTDTANSPVNLFDKMQFHPRVIEASKSLFESGHYAQAIFEAFKAVENFVRERSGLSSYGKNLMVTAFNEENPIIKVPEAGYFDKDVQEGFKFLFMGATQGIRNPKAHKEIVQNDPFITLEYLGFASFLLKRIDYWEADIS